MLIKKTVKFRVKKSKFALKKFHVKNNHLLKTLKNKMQGLPRSGILVSIPKFCIRQIVSDE